MFRIFLLIVLSIIPIIIISCGKSSERESTLLKSPAKYLVLSESVIIKNPRKAIIHLDKMLLEDSVLQTPEAHCNVLFCIGSAYLYQSKQSQAFSYFNSASEIASQHNLALWKAFCFLKLSKIAYDLGNTNLALHDAYKALTVFEIHYDSANIADACNIIGSIKSASGEFDSAYSYLNRALYINRKLKNISGQIVNKSNLAFYFVYKGEFDSVNNLYEEIIPQLIKDNDDINLSTIYSHLSLYYKWNSKNDSSNYYIRKAIQLAERIEDDYTLPTYYGMLGMNFKDQNNFDSARVYLAKSMRIAKKHNDYFTQRQALLLLIGMDTLEGNHKKTYHDFLQVLALNDSIYKQDSQNNIEAAELKYENHRKDNNLKQDKLNLENEKREKQLFLFLLITTIVLILILGIIINTLKRNFYLKKQEFNNQIRLQALEIENTKFNEEVKRLKIENIEKELKIKEQEQISHALAMEQKNILLTNISSVIANSRGVVDYNNSYINELKSTIHEHLRTSKERDLFNEKFTLIHPDFFITLKNNHPTLTKNEIKYLAYLKLNLDNNQISEILNITYEAIKKTRYRIRKKIDIAKCTTLEDYISRF